MIRLLPDLRMVFFAGLLCETTCDAAPLPASPRVVPVPVSMVEKDGIAWYFDREYPVGTFANGDYWVVGPATITRITPDGDGKENGWEVNPRFTGGQGFSADLDRFDANLVPALPYTARPGESLVKTVRSTHPGSGGDCRECLERAAVLTVIDSKTASRGNRLFRPPYTGLDKSHYSLDALRLDLLPSIDFRGNAPTLAWVEESFGPVQLDHKPGGLGRDLHPTENIPDYGSDICRRNADAALRLMLADPVDRKMDALVAYVQYGIDLYGMMQDGHRWGAGGGHRPGQKLPLLFAAVMLDDTDMQQALKEADFFHEDNLVYRGEGSDTALFGGSGGYDRELLETKYWTALFSYYSNGKAEGYKAFRDPYGFIDGGPAPGEFYQFCCTSQPWKGEALACMIMTPLREQWNNPVFFEYVTRWVTHGTWTRPDPCAPPDSLWERYGVSFGPDGRGGCIPDRDSSDGVGRYPQRHGTHTDGGYRASGFQSALWDFVYTEGIAAGHNREEDE